MKPDGNVAFKVTWVYGKHGAFTSPCTSEGRYYNIWLDKKVWCSQKQCPCKKLFDARSNDDYDRQRHDYWPCYDAAIFSKWSFGPGVYHKGRKQDKEIQFKHFKVGKLAFFTSRAHEMKEEDRIIIGCYEISGSSYDEDMETRALVAGNLKLRVMDLSKAPRFWDFHKQGGPPKWGTGLFRYIPDIEAQAMLDAVKKAGAF